MKPKRPETATDATPRKACVKCRAVKPETEFYHVTAGYPWRQGTCKDCHNTQSLAALRRKRARLFSDTPS